MDEKQIDLPQIGEILKEEFMEPLGLSQSDVARAILVPRARISDIVSGNRAVTADTDLRLSKFFGLTEGYFLRIQERLDILKVKRLIADDLNNIKTFQPDGGDVTSV